MQLPNTSPQRPWPLPKDLNLPILSYLSVKDCLAFSRVSKGCLAIIKELDEKLFATSSIKPERLKHLSWRLIAANTYTYPKSSKSEKRSDNPSISKLSQLKRIGQMICIRYKDEQRLIDYKANRFRIFSKDDKIVHASFLSALVFRNGHYEIFDIHTQTRVIMPDGVEVDPSNQAILCFEGEKAAIVVSREGQNRLALADRKCVDLVDCPLDRDVRLYSLGDLLAVVNKLSVALIGFDGSVKKTLNFENEVRKCKVSTNEFWISTERHIFAYDKKSLCEKKVYPIANPNVIYVNGYLVEYRPPRFIITGEKIAYSQPMQVDTRVNYHKEVKGLLYLKLNHVAYVYDLKENELKQIDTGYLIVSDHFWIENHLVTITGRGETHKFVG